MTNPFFFPNWAEALGWTLLHSLWQGLLIYAMLFVGLRLVDSRRAVLRYAMASTALVLTILAASTTFLFLADVGVERPFSGEEVTVKPLPVWFSSVDVPENGVVERVVNGVEHAMPWILWTWFAGALFFSTRLLAGYWYVNVLRTDSLPVGNGWSGRLRLFCNELGIRKKVVLAESVRVQTPMVVGWIKPMILIPTGMLSGLTTEEVETIFLHELAHIRRHDYLVNAFQSLVEAVFFFNPFVWWISGIIRREREYCCDDEVLRRNRDALAYARALAALERARLQAPAFAVPLGGDQNQLLYRIKRIMEKSAKNYSIHERLLPALLIVIGVLCASWITIGPESGRPDNTPVLHRSPAVEPTTTLQDDTLGKRKDKTAYYSKKTIITYDEHGQPHEETKEEYRGDESLRDLMQNFDFDPFASPASPSVNVPGFYGMPDVFAGSGLFPFSNFESMMDTVPPRLQGKADWEEFRRTFEEQFNEKFKEFYKEHQFQFDDVMKNVEALMEKRWHEREAWHRAMTGEQLERAEEAVRRAREQFQGEEFASRMQEVQKEMMRVQEQMASRLADIEGITGFHRDFHGLHEALKDQLVKDELLRADENITSLQWDADGELLINGKEVSPPDLKKYEEIRARYLGKGGSYRYVE